MAFLASRDRYISKTKSVTPDFFFFAFLTSDLLAV